MKDLTALELEQISNKFKERARKFTASPEAALKIPKSMRELIRLGVTTGTAGIEHELLDGMRNFMAQKFTAALLKALNVNSPEKAELIIYELWLTLTEDSSDET